MRFFQTFHDLIDRRQKNEILFFRNQLFAFFQIDDRAAADDQCGDDAGQGLTGGRFAVGVGGADLEHIVFVRTVGTLVAAVNGQSTINDA